MTRSTSARRPAVRINPDSPTGVPLTNPDQATHTDRRVTQPRSTTCHAPWEQLRLW